jgi:hypothetical protein
MTSERMYWRLSAIISCFLSLVLVALWITMSDYEFDERQLSSHDEAMSKIKDTWSSHNEDPGAQSKDTLMTLPTGVFIQSLQFLNSSDVNVSGYIWQRYACDPIAGAAAGSAVSSPSKCTNANIPIPEVGDTGFILPEQVYSGSDISPNEVYRKLTADKAHLKIAWYFEATLRQAFEYKWYPFERKTAWLRMWPKEFSKNLVLIPDYEAYDSTSIDDIFGIETDIVLGPWIIEDTYFDYHFTHYDTNFGIEGYIGKDNFPELYFNFVVKRKLGSAFIVYLLPLALVATLLFGAMLTVTHNDVISEHMVFNTSGFIVASSGLFFVVMFAHIQFRKQFPDSGTIYIEYFYIWMYMIIVTTAANAYLFSVSSPALDGVLQRQDNLIPKVIYWPILIGGFIAITLWVALITDISPYTHR